MNEYFYIGFIKRAVQRGMPIPNAEQLFKKANLEDYIKPTLIGGGLGAGILGLKSLLQNPENEKPENKKKRLINNLITGFGLGGLAGAGYHGFKELFRNIPNNSPITPSATTPTVDTITTNESTTPVIKNWKDTGFDISRTPSKESTPFSKESEGSITPRNYLKQIYGDATDEEIGKANEYLSKNLSKTTNSVHGIDDPIELYSDPALVNFANLEKNYINISPDELELPASRYALYRNRFESNLNHLVPPLPLTQVKDLHNFISKTKEEVSNGTSLNEATLKYYPLIKKWRTDPADFYPIQSSTADSLRHEITHQYGRDLVDILKDINTKNLPISTGYFSSAEERATGLHTLQQDLFRQAGQRAESPEQFKEIIDRVLNSDNIENKLDAEGFSKNTKRYFRYLNNLKINFPDLFKKITEGDAKFAPAFVQQNNSISFNQPV